MFVAEEVQKLLDSLKRCQSLEEVQRLHEAGEHLLVVDTLLQTFSQHMGRGRGGVGIPERHAQLLLLQDSLIKLKDYRVREGTGEGMSGPTMAG